MIDTLANTILRFVPSHRIDCFGKNSLLFNSAPYYVLLAIMLIGIGLFHVTGNAYILLFIIYAILPTLDELITLDTRNPSNE